MLLPPGACNVFRGAEKCHNLDAFALPGFSTMRSRVRKFAHLLERIGLAMAGSAGGLFVAAHVGSSIAVLTSQGFIVIMMIGGAIGFYLGIDTPPLAFHGPYSELSKGGSSGKVDSAEFLSAVGTFLATLKAADEDVTVDGVAVTNDVSRRYFPTIGLGELARNPFSRWVRSHSQPQNLAAIVLQNQQPVEQSE